MSHVIDASAVLAFLNEEPGSDAIEALLTDAMISTVNLIEVGTKLVDKGMTLDEARQVWSALGLNVKELNELLAGESVGLRGATRAHGLSLGDRACLALAKAEGATAVTADRMWADLDIGCKIEVIR
ncbi:MAG: type II toxin-antitoxin system VapC family toxin [Rhizobiaceae bacterium]